MKKTIINKEDRKRMELDPYFQQCCLFGHKGHECGGRVTREHAIIYSGKKVQKYWAIIPLCAKYHEVDQFQDSGFMTKEVNVWVALNRATEEELKEISKATDLIRLRDRLNKKYGVYQSKVSDDIQY